MIDQILRTPRATQPNAAQPQTGAQQIGGGIAGVASTAERTGIKIYKEMEKYNEWEFLYDLMQDKTGLGGQVPQQQQPFGQQPLGQQPYGQQPLGQQPYGQQPFGPQSPVQRPRR